MNRSESRQLSRNLERRVLGGERKADIVGQAAADGGDWQLVARRLAVIPTPASRRRCRVANRALVVLLALAAAGEVVGLLAYDHGLWLLLDLLFPLLFIAALSSVSRYRARGYTLAVSVATLRLGWWALSVSVHHLVTAPGALVTAQIAVCLAIGVLALLVQHRLLPASSWTSLAPLSDAEGNLVFEE